MTGWVFWKHASKIAYLYRYDREKIRYVWEILPLIFTNNVTQCSWVIHCLYPNCRTPYRAARQFQYVWKEVLRACRSVITEKKKNDFLRSLLQLSHHRNAMFCRIRLARYTLHTSLGIVREKQWKNKVQSTTFSPADNLNSQHATGLSVQVLSAGVRVLLASDPRVPANAPRLQF